MSCFFRWESSHLFIPYPSHTISDALFFFWRPSYEMTPKSLSLSRARFIITATMIKPILPLCRNLTGRRFPKSAHPITCPVITMAIHILPIYIDIAECPNWCWHHEAEMLAWEETRAEGLCVDSGFLINPFTPSSEFMRSFPCQARSLLN